MINLINSWIKNIIVAVIITIIIEMILPEGKNKKYIKTVISIYIVFVVISPIFSKILNKKIDVSKIFDDYEIPEMQMNTIDNNTYIKEEYENKIKEDITMKLKNIGYETVNMEIKISTKDESYGQIEKISLNVKKKNENIEKVEKVDIENKTTKEEVITLPEEDRNKIIEYLINNYGVEETNIIIGGLQDER